MCLDFCSIGRARFAIGHGFAGPIIRIVRRPVPRQRFGSRCVAASGDPSYLIDWKRTGNWKHPDNWQGDEDSGLRVGNERIFTFSFEKSNSLPACDDRHHTSATRLHQLLSGLLVRHHNVSGKPTDFRCSVDFRSPCSCRVNDGPCRGLP